MFRSLTSFCRSGNLGEVSVENNLRHEHFIYEEGKKNENFEACKSLGIKTINLEYEDAIYRKKDNIYLYPNDGDIFKKIAPDDSLLLEKIYTNFKKRFSKKSDIRETNREPYGKPYSNKKETI